MENEIVRERHSPTRADARAEIFEFFEVFYNRHLLHQKLGYITPEQFETQNPVPFRGYLRSQG